MGPTDERDDIESVGADFNRYKNELQPLFIEHLQSIQRNAEYIVSQLDEYYLFLSYIGDKEVLSGAHRGTMHLAAKCATDILGISSCLRVGLSVQATILLRSLWETALTTQYIYRDFEKRIELFVNHRDYVKYRKVKRNPKVVPESEHARLESRYRKVKRYFSPRHEWYYKVMKEDIRKHPHLDPEKTPVNMHTMAIILGLEEEYNTMYQTLSLATHGNSVIDHLFMEGNRFQIGPRFNRELTKNTVGLAIHCGHMTMEPILKHINTPQSIALARYSRWLYCWALKTNAPLSLD